MASSTRRFSSSSSTLVRPETHSPSPEDSEECVNDTWLGLWNAIPPQRPSRFSAFVGRVARNLALKRFDYLTAAKRSPEAVCSLEELGSHRAPGWPPRPAPSRAL